MSFETRIGYGYDVHRFGPNVYGEGIIRLCGIDIPHDEALEGHSDADVGLHAICDAIFGALADGDIGSHFPPSDPQWKGASSDQFLDFAMGRIALKQGRLVNMDLTLVCEAPKIGPNRTAMRERVAEICKIDISRISIKGTTSERLGFMGRKEGIAAHAVVSIEIPRSS